MSSIGLICHFCTVQSAAALASPHSAGVWEAAIVAALLSCVNRRVTFNSSVVVVAVVFVCSFPEKSVEAE